MLALLLTVAVAAEPLSVEIKGLTTTEGTVICTLYSGEEHWLQTTGYTATTKAKPSGTGATCLFDSVAKGTYAVSFLHDVDDNEAMKTTWYGFPREPWGVSRDAPMRFGPPSFEESAFEHPGAAVVATAK